MTAYLVTQGSVRGTAPIAVDGSSTRVLGSEGCDITAQRRDAGRWGLRHWEVGPGT
jgi:hypothetical protein